MSTHVQKATTQTAFDTTSGVLFVDIISTGQMTVYEVHGLAPSRASSFGKRDTTLTPRATWASPWQFRASIFDKPKDTTINARRIGDPMIFLSKLLKKRLPPFSLLSMLLLYRASLRMACNGHERQNAPPHSVSSQNKGQHKDLVTPSTTPTRCKTAT